MLRGAGELHAFAGKDATSLTAPISTLGVGSATVLAGPAVREAAQADGLFVDERDPLFWDQIFAIELPTTASPTAAATAAAGAAAATTSDGGGDTATAATEPGSGSNRGLVFFRAESWERRVEWVMALSTLSVARTLALEEAAANEGGDGAETARMSSGSMSMTPSKVSPY